VRAAETLKSSHHPDGKVADLLAPTHVCTTVNALRSTTGGAYCRDLEISHRPDGKMADVLASTLARTTAADTLVNYSLRYVPQRPEISHRPDGKFAGVSGTYISLLTLLDDSRFGHVSHLPIGPHGKMPC
jgi:hypothetical protein